VKNSLFPKWAYRIIDFLIKEYYGNCGSHQKYMFYSEEIMDAKFNLLKLFTIFFLILPVTSFGADFNKLTAKYIATAQRRDLKALFEMSLFNQQNIKAIKATSPKFRIEKEINELFEREKSYLQYWMFTPSVKWKVLETKKTKLPMLDGKWINGRIVFVETEYIYNDAPLVDYKPLKKGVFTIVFDEMSGLYYKVDSYNSEYIYWDTPVRVRNLTYTSDNRSLDLRFDIDGGQPYTNKIYINGQPINTFLGKYANDFWIQELDAGRWLHLLALEWPPGTVFPLKLRVEVTDSSPTSQSGYAEVMINEGIIMKQQDE